MKETNSIRTRGISTRYVKATSFQKRKMVGLELLKKIDATMKMFHFNCFHCSFIGPTSMEHVSK